MEQARADDILEAGGYSTDNEAIKRLRATIREDIVKLYKIAGNCKEREWNEITENRSHKNDCYNLYRILQRFLGMEG